jgi:hypothetical protein
MSTQLPNRYVVQQGAHAQEHPIQVSLLEFVFFVEHNISFDTAEWEEHGEMVKSKCGGIQNMLDMVHESYN